MTDKKIAQWAGVTPRSLQNWKKPKILDNPEGKHNIYRSLKLGYYLLNYHQTEDEESKHFNKLEELITSVESLYSLVEIVENTTLPDDIRENAQKQLKSTIADLKEECSKLFNLI